MKACYIHSVVSISAQESFSEDVLFSEIKNYSEFKVSAIHPSYRDYIAPAQLRRMSPAVKMGVAASKKALEMAAVTQPDAIITGTGLGCIADTETFLNTVINQEEQFLTPTAFIQSTHNTVAGQIALALKCKAYNTTYVHGSVSFESALIDAQLQIETEEAKQVLVGCVDELGTKFVDYIHLVEQSQQPSINVPLGEGATFGVLSSKQKGAAAVLNAVEINSKITIDEITTKIKAFLKQNQVAIDEVDAVILGINGDGFDIYYQTITELFVNSDILQFKKYVGEFFSASGFAFWMGTELLSGKTLPEAFYVKKVDKNPNKTVLLYNQFKGSQHSFVLLSQC